MLVQADNPATLDVASRTGVLIECVLTDGAQLLPLGVFGNDELRGFLIFADLLAFLKLLVLGIAHQQ